jgi:hypothetical protein
MAKRLLPLFLLMALLVAACSQATEPATTEPAADPATTAPVAADEPVAPTRAATESAPATEPAQATVEKPENAQQQPTNLPAEPSVTVPPPTEVAVFNGAYENTYFRGSETAPVTLIDYSDFL